MFRWLCCDNTFINELIILITSGVISLILSVLVLLITDNKNKKKEVFNKRISVYIECFEILKQYKDNPPLAFDNDFIMKIKKSYYDMIMFASDKVINIYKNIYLQIITLNKDYNDKFRTSDGHNNLLNQIELDKEFNSIEEYEEVYISKKSEKTEIIESNLIDLVNVMRNELKTIK